MRIVENFHPVRLMDFYSAEKNGGCTVVDCPHFLSHVGAPSWCDSSRLEAAPTLGSPALSIVEGLFPCACAEPCPDESQDLFSIKTKKIKY